MRRQLLPLLALFVALGGSAYATGFPANVIGTKQLKNGAVTRPKVRANAVNGAKIAGDSVRGADVAEATVGPVASAAHATVAAAVPVAASADNTPNATTTANATQAGNASGLARTAASGYQRQAVGTCPAGNPMRFLMDNGTVFCRELPIVKPVSMTSAAGDPVKVISVGRLQVSLICHGLSDSVRLNFGNPGPGAATLNWFYANSAGTVSASGTSLAENGLQQVPFHGDRIEGQFIFSNQTGTSISTVRLHAYDGTGFCEVRGTGLFAA